MLFLEIIILFLITSLANVNYSQKPAYLFKKEESEQISYFLECHTSLTKYPFLFYFQENGRFYSIFVDFGDYES